LQDKYGIQPEHGLCAIALYDYQAGTVLEQWLLGKYGIQPEHGLCAIAVYDYQAGNVLEQQWLLDKYRIHCNCIRIKIESNLVP
jgi:hypothetical protein